MVKIRVVSEFAGEAITKKLAKLKLPLLKLGDIPAVSVAERKSILRGFLEKNSWIIEGNQAGMWTLDTIHQAEFILVTDASTMTRNARSMNDYAKQKVSVLKNKDLDRVLKILGWNVKEILVKFDEKRNTHRIIVFNEMRIA